MKRYQLVMLWLIATGAYGQTHVDAYINAALTGNESVHQQQLLLAKSSYAVKEAKANAVPTIGFNATYSLADGGRRINFPAGDLLNPVYKALNRLTGRGNFPEVQNQSILLNPNNFYDARVRTSFPLLNAGIKYNRKIATSNYNVQEIETARYKRELVKEVKTTYYKYLQAAATVNIYEAALSLARENLRINTALFNNQKINRTSVIRSDNEISKYNASLESAIQDKNNAAASFNFLLNRDLKTVIVPDSISSLPAIARENDTAVGNREELAKLNETVTINKQVTALARSYIRPTINAFADLGSQGFGSEVNRKSLYYLAGLSLQWNIFSGNKNKYKIQQAEVDGRVLLYRVNYVTQELKLQVTLSVNSYSAAVSRYRAALDQVSFSRRYNTDISRLYKEGQALYIELLDAQNQLITAQLQLNISLFDAWIKAAEIERANAGYPLK